MNSPNDPKNTDSAWEDAMTRDFDARVRDLHEAPLGLDSVKGKAHKIKRNRRAAVAGGILGVAAIITPIAVLSSGGTTESEKPPVVNDPTETIADPVSSEPDYVLDGVWHQADGDEVDLPESDQPYQSAVVWNGNLVATRWDGEVYNIAVVVADDGTLLTTFETTGPVVVNDAGTVAAWIETDGTVIAADTEELPVGTVDLGAPGEGIAWYAAAISGGPSCIDDPEGCTVLLNSNLGEDARAFSSLGGDEVVAPGVIKVFDATAEGTVTVISEVTEDFNTCGGPLDLIDSTIRWTSCEFQAQQISPDEAHIAALPSQFDGLGPISISVVDAQTQEVTGHYSSEGGFIGYWAWTTEGNLLLSAYDGARWHLISMATDGEITEIGKPIKGAAEDSPFALIQH